MLPRALISEGPERLDTCGLIDASRYETHAADVPIEDLEQRHASAGLSLAHDTGTEEEEEEDDDDDDDLPPGIVQPASPALRSA